jgi:hypothetical protein
MREKKGMYKKFIKTTLLFLARFSPVLFIVGPLFFSKGYIFLMDLTWGSHAAYNWATPSNQLFLLNVVNKALSFVLSADLIEKLYITLCLGFVLWGGRKIAGLFLKNQWLIFIASLFALFNPFVYDRAMFGQYMVVSAFGLMLLGMGFLLEYTEKRQARQMLFAGLSFAFAIQCSPPFLFFIAAFYPFIFLPGFFIGTREVAGGVKASVKIKIIDAVKISIVLIVIAFVLNANWIIGGVAGTSALGQFVSSGITRQDLIAFQTSGNTDVGALVNVLMLSGFWAKNQSRYVDLTTLVYWGWSFFLLLPLIIWGFVAGLRSKEKKYRVMTVGAGLLFAISMVLAAGIRIPIGRGITYFLFDHLPFYKGLRETQKWVSVTAAIYLVFLSVGLREFFATKIIKRHASMMKIIVGATIVMAAPLLLFGFGGQVKPVPYPSDWYAVNDYIVKDSGCSGSTLFFPWHMYMKFSWVGRVIADPAPSFFQCPVVGGTDVEWGGIYDNSKDSEGAAVEQWLETREGTDLLQNNTFNIRYIILAKEVDWKNYAELDNNPALQLVMETPTLRVYKVK